MIMKFLSDFVSHYIRIHIRISYLLIKKKKKHDEWYKYLKEVTRKDGNTLLLILNTRISFICFVDVYFSNLLVNNKLIE
jgi:hypothetical protein